MSALMALTMLAKLVNKDWEGAVMRVAFCCVFCGVIKIVSQLKICKCAILARGISVLLRACWLWPASLMVRHRGRMSPVHRTLNAAGNPCLNEAWFLSSAGRRSQNAGSDK